MKNLCDKDVIINIEIKKSFLNFDIRLSEQKFQNIFLPFTCFVIYTILPIFLDYIEPCTKSALLKKLLLKSLQYSQENTCIGASKVASLEFLEHLSAACFNFELNKLYLLFKSLSYKKHCERF